MGLNSKLGWMVALLPEAIQLKVTPLLENVDFFLEVVVHPVWKKDGVQGRPWWERIGSLLPTLVPLVEAFIEEATRDPEFIFRLLSRAEQALELLQEHPELLNSAASIMGGVVDRASGQAFNFLEYVNRPQTNKRSLELFDLLERFVMHWIEEATSRVED